MPEKEWRHWREEEAELLGPKYRPRTEKPPPPSAAKPPPPSAAKPPPPSPAKTAVGAGQTFYSTGPAMALGSLTQRIAGVFTFFSVIGFIVLISQGEVEFAVLAALSGAPFLALTACIGTIVKLLATQVQLQQASTHNAP